MASLSTSSIRNTIKEEWLSGAQDLEIWVLMEENTTMISSGSSVSKLTIQGITTLSIAENSFTLLESGAMAMKRLELSSKSGQRNSSGSLRGNMMTFISSRTLNTLRLSLPFGGKMEIVGALRVVTPETNYSGSLSLDMNLSLVIL